MDDKTKGRIKAIVKFIGYTAFSVVLFYFMKLYAVFLTASVKLIEGLDVAAMTSFERMILFFLIMYVVFAIGAAILNKTAYLLEKM